jgi:hypothetical protein
VDDDVHVPERADEGFRVTDIALEDLDVDSAEVVAAPAGEIVEPADIVPAGKQPADEVRPDEAARAGDEDALGNALYRDAERGASLRTTAPSSPVSPSTL